MAVGGTRPMTLTTSDGVGPEEGDFLLNPETGTTYAVERSRPSPSKPGVFNLLVTRLDQWAVMPGEPGVIPMEWTRR